jgi:ABC-type Mn2+/Zn2+ transport system permease subunit
MQTLCIGQGATLGVLLGIGLCQALHASDLLEVSLPFAFAFTGAAITYLISERVVSIKSASSNTHFTAIFAALLGGGYLVSALFPALENHMAQKYFGDIATISEQSARFVLVFALLLFGCMLKFQRNISRDSFAAAIRGARLSTSNLFFSLGTLITISLSVQLVGFLFTVACLFIPTSIQSFNRRIGLKRHLLACLAIAAFSCCMGFVLTLWQTNLPTVPTIIVTMASTAFIVNWFSSCSDSKKSARNGV